MEDKNVHVDVAVLKNQVSTLTNLCNKMDSVIEKLMDQTERNIERVYDDMEARKKETDADHKDVHTRIDTVLEKVDASERRIMAKITEEMNLLKRELTNPDKPMSITEKIKEWKFMTLGGLLVLGWLLEHLNYDTLKVLFGIK